MSKLDMFLALNGSRQGAIRGESIVAGHESEIEVKGWSWGMSQEINPLTNKASKTAPQAITFSKEVDSASTAIMSAIKAAEVLSTVELTCRDAGGERPLDVLRIKLKNARICDYSIVGQDSDGRQIRETFSIAFKDIEVTYAPKSSANFKSGACTFVDRYE